MKPVMAVVAIENAIDELAVNPWRQLAAKSCRGLPGEIRPHIEWADVRAGSDVIFPAEVIAPAKSNGRIEPLIRAANIFVQGLP